MEKTFNEILNAVKDGSSVQFIPSKIYPSKIILVIENFGIKRGKSVPIPPSLFEIVDPAVKDYAFHELIKRTNKEVLLLK